MSCAGGKGCSGQLPLPAEIDRLRRINAELLAALEHVAAGNDIGFTRLSYTDARVIRVAIAKAKEAA